jgi:hypothetical protein
MFIFIFSFKYERVNKKKHLKILSFIAIIAFYIVPKFYSLDMNGLLWTRITYNFVRFR